MTESRCYRCMDRWTQRTTVSGSWFVIPEICFTNVRRKLIPQEVNGHNNIGLLHNVGLLHTFWAEDHVDRRKSRLVRPEVNLILLEISGELLIEEAPRIKSGCHRICQLRPEDRFRFRQLQPFCKLMPTVSPPRAQQIGHIGTTAKIPSCHQVGVSIVVYILVVFVRPNHVTNVVEAIRFEPSSARPKPGAFNN